MTLSGLIPFYNRSVVVARTLERNTQKEAVYTLVCRPAAVTSRCFCCANQTYNSSTAGCGVMSLAKKRLDCFGKLGRRKKRDKKYEHLATQQENSNKSVGTVMKMMVGSAAVFHHWI